MRLLFAFILLLIPTRLGASSGFPLFEVFTGAPSKVRVGSYTYHVHYVESLYGQRGERLLGMCNLNTKEIFIKTPDPELESTLVHEFIHAMVFESGFDMDEQSVLKMESALFAFFKQNYFLVSR